VKTLFQRHLSENGFSKRRLSLRLASTLPAVLALALAAGCSTIGEFEENSRIDYKSSANKAVSLEVPPDLTQLTRDARYVVPGTAVTASGYQAAQPATIGTTAAQAVGDVKIERSGNQRWLVVNRPAEKVWGPVHDFWREAGFLLVQDQENLGIMETDWAENRAKIPQDFIRNSLGKLLDSIYSTGERDKFRTRLERTGSGGGSTEIYVSHRGMVETITGGRGANTQATGDGTVWQPRPADPELEAEFLRRLMVKLGTPAEQSKTLVAAGSAVKQTSRVTTVNNQPVLEIDEDFERAWRRVGLALDRTGFTVEDRDRAQGTFFVRYVEPNADKSEPGLFSKLFSRPTVVPPLKYRIAVRGQGNVTLVSVLDAQGAAENSANAQRIVQIIADDLR
jgi:outer membrane protein assembly factor BamC